MRRDTLSLLLATLSTCAPRPMRPPPARLVEVAIDPPASGPDRLARAPRITLVFDRALAPPGSEALWVLRGPPPDSLASEGLRGALGSTNAARRLDALAALDPADPTRVTVTLREALLPDTAFTVATSVHLVTAEGAPVAPTQGAPGPVIHGFRVAPARECPPLARLQFPTASDVPRAITRVVVAFDRPVFTTGEGPVAVLLDPDQTGVPATADLGCGDASHGFRCLELALEPGSVLAPLARYEVRLGPLADDGGLAPQAIDLGFTTGEAEMPPPAPASAPVACATDEIARPPFCVRVLANAVEVRGETQAPGALRARVATRTAESPAGMRHVVRVEDVPRETALPVYVWTVALDGSVSERHVLESVATAPALPRLRVTEVLARPRSTAAQEFVEIVNDEPTGVSLAGLAIATPSGRSLLPEATLAPGARALIVGAAFDPRGAPRAGDPPVAPGTLLVRLATSLASRGLADRGTDVWLADGAGHVISRAPLGSGYYPPQPGVSVVRADVRMKEDDPASWSYDAEGGSTPGLPDRTR
jgi:hypothetical protein